MASSGREIQDRALGPVVTCSRCEAIVRFPAKYCDMCGGRLAQDAPFDFRFIPIQLAEPQADQLPEPAPAVAIPESHLVPPAGRQKHRTPEVESVGALQEYSRSSVDTEAACRSLRSAYLHLKGNEELLESIEALDYQKSFGSALWSTFASRVRMRPEIAELHRTLDLVVSEVSKASDLDSDAVIETEDGPLNAPALMSSADRARGNIEFASGRLRKAILRYQTSIETSIDKLKSQGAYFDMAVAYERIGKPGKALLAYESCGEISPDTEVGIDALYHAEELRSKMIMGGWFVGSQKIVLIMATGMLSGFAFLPLSPMAGIVNLGLWGGALVLYCVANFRWMVRPG